MPKKPSAVLDRSSQLGGWFDWIKKAGRFGYSHGDVGPRSTVEPGHQDRRWKDLWVDSALKDEWLERMNAIPGIHVTETCAGHMEARVKTAWLEQVFGMPRYVTFFPVNTHISYLSESPTPIADLMSSLGDLALVSEQAPMSSEELKTTREEARRLDKPFLVYQSQDKYGPEVNISSSRPINEMSESDFEWWWETVLWAMERAGSGS